MEKAKQKTRRDPMDMGAKGGALAGGSEYLLLVYFHTDYSRRTKMHERISSLGLTIESKPVEV